MENWHTSWQYNNFLKHNFLDICSCAFNCREQVKNLFLLNINRVVTQWQWQKNSSGEFRLRHWGKRVKALRWRGEWSSRLRSKGSNLIRHLAGLRHFNLLQGSQWPLGHSHNITCDQNQVRKAASLSVAQS